MVKNIILFTFLTLVFLCLFLAWNYYKSRNQLTLLTLENEQSGNIYAVINNKIKKVDKRNFSHFTFYDFNFKIPLKELTDSQFDQLDELETKLKEYMSGNNSIWIGHISKYKKREIIFYSEVVFIPEDKIISSLTKEYFEIEILTGEDPNWSQIELFTEKLKK